MKKKNMWNKVASVMLAFVMMMQFAVPVFAETGVGSVSAPASISAVTPPASSAVTPPASSAVTPPASSMVTPPASSAVTPPASSMVTPPASSTVTPPADNAVTPLATEKITINGIENTRGYVGTYFDCLAGTSLTVENAPAGTQYRLGISFIGSPQGSEYQYGVDDTGFMPGVNDEYAVFSVTYIVESSTNGTNWTKVSLPSSVNTSRNIEIFNGPAPTPSKVSLKWSTTNTTPPIDNGYTGALLAPRQEQAEVTLVLDNGVYEVNRIEMRFPLQLYAYRDGKAAVPTGYGVPQAPNTSAESSFNYTIDTKGTPTEADDEVVFKNHKRITTGGTFKIQWSYLLRPGDTIDGTNATLAVKLHTESSETGQQVPFNTTSNNITYKMDTQVSAIAVTMEDDKYQPAFHAWTANNKLLNEEWNNYYFTATMQDAWGAPPASIDVYRQSFWQVWYVNIQKTSAGNQPGTLSATFDLPVGAEIYNVYSFPQNNNTGYTMKGNTITRPYLPTEETSGEIDRLRILVRYPKDTITTDTFNQSAQIKMEGIDQKDAVTPSAVTASVATTVSIMNDIVYGGTKQAIYTWPSDAVECGYGPKPADWDAGKNIYVEWHTIVDVQGHPDSTLAVTQDVSKDGGKVIAVATRKNADAQKRLGYYSWNAATNTVTLSGDLIDPLDGNQTPWRADQQYNLRQSKTIRVIVAYPKTGLDAAGGKTVSISGVAKLSDANIAYTGNKREDSFSQSLYWKPYELPKDSSSINAYLRYGNYVDQKCFSLTEIENGYDCDSVIEEINSDVSLYNSKDKSAVLKSKAPNLQMGTGASSQTQKLTGADYNLRDFDVTIRAFYKDPDTGAEKPWFQSKPEDTNNVAPPVMELYLELDGVLQSTPIKTGNFRDNDNLNVSNGEQWPNHITGYEIRLSGLTNTTVGMGTNYEYVLKKSSPVIQKFLSNHPNENEATLITNRELTTDMAGLQHKSSEKKLVLEKYIADRAVDNMLIVSEPTEDTAHRLVNYTVTAKTNDKLATGFYDSKGLKQLYIDGKIPGNLLHEQLYTLLPKGMMFNENLPINFEESSANRPIDSYRVDKVKTVDDYKGTGRQMVVIDCSYKLADRCNANSFYKPTTSGIRLSFTASVPFHNLHLLDVNSNYILSAVQRSDGTTFQDAVNTHADTVSDGKTDTAMEQHKLVLDKNGKSVFEDVNEDADKIKINTVYANTSFPKPLVNTTFELGLSKWVRAKGDANGGGYGKTSAAKCGETYEYSLQVQTGDATGTTTSDVILYDVLETADKMNAGAASDSHWNGTLESVNVSVPRSMGIDAQVWYCTKTGLKDDTVAASFATKADWTQTIPTDKNTITAVAVDLSKKVGGGAYVFKTNEGTSVTLTMRAPAKWQVGQAFNRAVMTSTLTRGSGSSKDESTTARTATDLYVAPRYEITSVPETGAIGGTAAILKQGDIVTYTLHLNPGAGKNGTNDYGTLSMELLGAQRDVRANIPLPAGMEFVASSLKGNVKGTSSSGYGYDAATRSVYFDAKVFSPEESTLTFKAFVKPFVSDTNQTYLAYADIQNLKAERTNMLRHEALANDITMYQDPYIVNSDNTLSEIAQGSAGNPTVVPLGSTLEYRMSLRSLKSEPSGQFIVTETLPKGTTYVANSATQAITKANSTSKAMLLSVKEITDAADKVTSIEWIFDQFEKNDTAACSFRVTTPKTTDSPATPEWESNFDFSNSVTLQDMALKNATYKETTTVVIARDPYNVTYAAGDRMYTDAQCTKTDTTYQRVSDPRSTWKLGMQIDNSSTKPLTFYAQIFYTPAGSTNTEVFYHKVTIPAGQTNAMVPVNALKDGNYNAIHLRTNWRYPPRSSVNPNVSMPRDNNINSTLAYYRGYQKWLSDSTILSNAMPALP